MPKFRISCPLSFLVSWEIEANDSKSAISLHKEAVRLADAGIRGMPEGKTVQIETPLHAKVELIRD